MKPLRLYVIAIDESFFINPIIKWLIENYHRQIAGISIVSDQRENQSLSDYYKKIYRMYRFSGTIKLAGMLILIRLKELLGLSDSVPGLIRKYKLDLVETGSVNDPSFVSLIKSKNVDIIFSFCGEIYGKEILDAVNIGAINKHCALLPMHRGLYPVFWAMLNSEREIGVTLHLMDLEIDAGAILTQKRVPLSAGDTMHTAYSKCHNLVPEMMKEVMDHYAGGKKPEMKTRPEGGSYHSHPQKEDIDRFYKSGHRTV